MAIRRIFLILLCMACLATGAGSARAEAGGTGGNAGAIETTVQTLFDAMIVRFAAGDMDKAHELAAEIESKGGIGYKNASMYIAYLKGLKALETDDYQSAETYFKPLVAADFELSAGYYAYVRGRSLQVIGEYAKALEQYDTAFSLGVFEGYTFYADCQKALQKEQYSAAERYEQQGNYLRAAELFTALEAYADSAVRSRKCTYKAALALAEVQEYERAAELFHSLGDYEDSQAQALAHYDLARNISVNRCLSALVCDSAGDTTLALSWKDEQNLGAYTVLCYPRGMKSVAQPLETAQCAVTVTGLAPSADYVVEVTSKASAVAYVSAVFSTARAGYAPASMQLYSMEVMTYSLRDCLNHRLTELEPKGLAQPLPEGVVYTASRSMSDAGTGYMVAASFSRARTEAEHRGRYLCVLRVGGDYVCQVEGEEDIKGFWTFVTLYVDLTGLFDNVYKAAGSWPSGLATVSLYMDGALLGETHIRLEEFMK